MRLRFYDYSLRLLITHHTNEGPTLKKKQNLCSFSVSTEKRSDTQLQKHLNSWFSTWLDRQPLFLHGGRIFREACVFEPPPAPSYCYMTYLKLSVIAYPCVCVHVSINIGTWEVANVHSKHKTPWSGVLLGVSGAASQSLNRLPH